jgi:hypothetical protein
LLLEHGFDQAAAVVALLVQAGFIDCKTLADLASQPRVSIGRLPHAATASSNSAANQQDSNQSNKHTTGR